MMISNPYTDLHIKRRRDEDSEFSQPKFWKRALYSNENIDDSIALDLHQSLLLDDDHARNKRGIEDISDDLWDIEDSDDLTQARHRPRREPESEAAPTVDIINDNIEQVVLPRKNKYISSHADYLVDEVIRKHRKNMFRDPSAPDDFDSRIPNYVGPNPCGDHALSQLVPAFMTDKALHAVTTPVVPSYPRRNERQKASAALSTVSHRECFENGTGPDDPPPEMLSYSCWPPGNGVGPSMEICCDDEYVSSDEDVEDLGAF
jgi:hypothetical protein